MDEALLSDRFEADVDTRSFMAFAMKQGWGDGLPLVAPTEELVRAYIDASGIAGPDVVAYLPPSRAECTVELVAVNAVIAVRYRA